MASSSFNFVHFLIYGLCFATLVSSSLENELKKPETPLGAINDAKFSNLTQSGKQYVGYNLYMSFIDFIEHCHKLGLQPANVLTKEENDVLTTYLDGNFADPKYFWLGGADIGREGRYYWIASLSEFTFTSWGPGYPNGGRDENCATIYGGDGSWYDQYCTNDGVQPLCQTIP
ncbi:Perlucin-like protein [Orchesella cincta]|uniref:Perlucin-like protein n=1 Tax=Orchesella cincta TaxID=48709 RepID=A0A1D2NC21_ORCCI|nr:Perlucin-like protein [Orchesella cincta]